jgi:PKD repeat protein
MLEGPTVSNQEPLAIIGAPEDGASFTTEDTFKLDGERSTDPDGDELTYVWNSNIDGIIGREQVIWPVLSEGEHIITLSVTDPHDAISVTTMNLTLVKLRAELDLTVMLNPAEPKETELVAVIATVSNIGFAPADLVKVSFSLDEEFIDQDDIGTLHEGDDRNSQVSITATPGDHNLKVWIDGYDVEEIVTFNVLERPGPTADAGPDIVVTAGAIVEFDGTFSSSHGLIMNYYWDFGDMTDDTGKITFHKYDTPGIFQVSLTVTDELGRESTDAMTVSVAEKPVEDKGAEVNLDIIIIAVGIVIILVIVGMLMLRRKKEPAAGNPASYEPFQSYYQTGYTQDQQMQDYVQTLQTIYDNQQTANAPAPQGYPQVPTAGNDAAGGGTVQSQTGNITSNAMSSPPTPQPAPLPVQPGQPEQ